MSIKVIVGLILIATIVMIFYIKRVSSKQSNYLLTVPTNIDKIVPDSPVSFGYKCMWFAIKSDNKKRIAEILELNNLTDCNWQIGIDKAYNGSVFITPSINGWTLVCGWGLPHGDSKKSIDTVKSKLKILSKEFNEAQFFCSHRVTEYHCWIKSTKGIFKEFIVYKEKRVRI